MLVIFKKEDGDQANKDEDKSVGSNDATDVLEEILNFFETIDKNYRRVTILNLYLDD